MNKVFELKKLRNFCFITITKNINVKFSFKKGKTNFNNETD